MKSANRYIAWVTAVAMGAMGFAVTRASDGDRSSEEARPAIVAADSCILKLTVPDGARVTIDGRDYGHGRKFIYQPLVPGTRYASRLDVRLENRREQRKVDIQGGRLVQVTILERAQQVSPAVSQREPNAQQPVPPAEAAELAQRTNDFGLELYSRLAAQPGNVLISPFCLETLLAMVSGGAGGQTREQMSTVLRLPPGASSHEAFAKLLDDLAQANRKTTDPKHPPSEWLSANAMWVQQGFDVRGEFVALARNDYRAEIGSLDFAQGATGARQKINDWVASSTRGKIPEIAPPGSPPANARLFLANAVYFRGRWAAPFDPKATRPEPFHLATGEDVQVPMMKLQERLRWARTERCQILELPYADERMAMLILLPDEKSELPSVEQKLSAAELTKWLDELRRREVRVSLPKFQIDSNASLAETLAAMGMPDAFSAAADFSGISEREGLLISSLIHRAWIGVDEQGTEAAAATGITVSPKSVSPYEPVTFTADRPFVFCIQDRATGTILFVGRVADPRNP